MTERSTPPESLATSRRTAVLRTAWIVGACAVTFYVLFFVSMLGGK